MNRRLIAAMMLSAAIAQPALARTARRAPAPTTAPVQARTPSLIVAISIDQFSLDLFNHYRNRLTGGLHTLSRGVVFTGYQSHAATETCPGHSTILSGVRPNRSGIVANDWYGTRGAAQPVDTHRDEIYCVEDETNPASSTEYPVVSLRHLSEAWQPLGDRLKAANGDRTRVFAVSGKDRGASLMAGRRADQTWWYRIDEVTRPDGSKGKTGHFATYMPGYGNVAATPPAIIGQVNDLVARELANPVRQTVAPGCDALEHPVAVGSVSVGGGPVPDATSPAGYRTTPQLDQHTLDIAEGLLRDYDLGANGHTDVLAISLSGTDYVGHAFGTAGPEMCTQLTMLDARLARFIDALKATGRPFVIAMTADHGGIDIPERGTVAGAADLPKTVGRSTFPLSLDDLNTASARLLGLYKPGQPTPRLITSKGIGDLWLTSDVPTDKRAALLSYLRTVIGSFNSVAAIYTRDQIMATPIPTASPEKWSLIERVRANYMDGRSGDLFVLLKDRVSPIPIAGAGYVATHGSAWDYDRRVPIAFWWPGVAPRQGGIAETVDILPTLGALISLPVPPASVDGHCRDIGYARAAGCRVAGR